MILLRSFVEITKVVNLKSLSNEKKEQRGRRFFNKMLICICILQNEAEVT